MNCGKLKEEYRGYECEVSREMCLGGWPMLYFSIFRISDGYECLTSFEDSAETLEDKMKQLKERIDSEHLEDDPWLENEGLGFFREEI